MGELLPKQRAEAARMGWTAVAAWAGTGLAVLVIHKIVVGLIGAGVAAWLTWRWFKFRASWGMRF